MFQRLTTGIGLSLATVLSLSATAQAASFQSNVSQKNNSEADIELQSIGQNGTTFSNFNLVNRATVLYNSPITPTANVVNTSNPENVPSGAVNNNSGAASTDKGDKATAPLPVSGMNNPTGNEVAAYLGNTNLNNIIDTEDRGSFSMNVFFANDIHADNTGLDNLFFWERGMNSSLGIQAIDKAGNLLGNFFKLTKDAQVAAGYSIDTMEIGGAQDVGTWGVNLLKDLGVNSAAGVRIMTNYSYNANGVGSVVNQNDNGPDFKVMARQSVPEPATLAGLGLVAGALGVSRRRQVRKA